jgi:5-methylcytosine-specific restriction endonuclease McrA
MTNTVRSTHSRHIPQDVKIRVSLRDRGMCRHVGCFRTTNLHFDHVIAYSKGGPSDQDWNIQLLCDQHNWRKGRSWPNAPYKAT